MKNECAKKEKWAQTLYSIIGSTTSPNDERAEFYQFFNNYLYVERRIAQIKSDNETLEKFFKNNPSINSFRVFLRYDEEYDIYVTQEIEINEEEFATILDMETIRVLKMILANTSFYRGEVASTSPYNTDEGILFTRDSFREIFNCAISEEQRQDFERVEYFEKRQLENNIQPNTNTRTRDIRKI